MLTVPNNFPKPLPNGYVYAIITVVELVDVDPSDAQQPYLYRLSNGEHVWIPPLPVPDNYTHERLLRDVGGPDAGA